MHLNLLRNLHFETGREGNVKRKEVYEILRSRGVSESQGEEGCGILKAGCHRCPSLVSEPLLGSGYDPAHTGS